MAVASSSVRTLPDPTPADVSPGSGWHWMAGYATVCRHHYHHYHNNDNNNNNNQICKAPECQKTSVALAYKNSRAN